MKLYFHHFKTTAPCVVYFYHLTKRPNSLYLTLVILLTIPLRIEVMLSSFVKLIKEGIIAVDPGAAERIITDNH